MRYNPSQPLSSFSLISPLSPPSMASDVPWTHLREVLQEPDFICLRHGTPGDVSIKTVTAETFRGDGSWLIVTMSQEEEQRLLADLDALITNCEEEGKRCPATEVPQAPCYNPSTEADALAHLLRSWRFAPENLTTHLLEACGLQVGPTPTKLAYDGRIPTEVLVGNHGFSPTARRAAQRCRPDFLPLARVNGVLKALGAVEVKGLDVLTDSVFDALDTIPSGCNATFTTSADSNAGGTSSDSASTGSHSTPLSKKATKSTVCTITGPPSARDSKLRRSARLDPPTQDFVRKETHHAILHLYNLASYLMHIGCAYGILTSCNRHTMIRVKHLERVIEVSKSFGYITRMGGSVGSEQASQKRATPLSTDPALASGHAPSVPVEECGPSKTTSTAPCKPRSVSPSPTSARLPVAPGRGVPLLWLYGAAVVRTANDLKASWAADPKIDRSAKEEKDENWTVTVPKLLSLGG